MGQILARAIGIPRAAWGAAFAHAGFGVTLLGLAATGWGVELILPMQTGGTYQLGPYEIALDVISQRDRDNYRETFARVGILKDGGRIGTIEPSRRYYASRKMSTTQAGIATLNFGQVYVSLADSRPDGSVDARLYWKPLVSLIWIGALVMAFGGILSLSDRRLRIGFARRAIRPVSTGQQPQAAE